MGTKMWILTILQGKVGRERGGDGAWSSVASQV